MNGCKDAWREQIDTGSTYRTAEEKIERLNREAKNKMGENLSMDAKGLLGSVWGMRMGNPDLTFQMVKSRPSARCQAALDELVSAGAVGKTLLPKRADGTHGVSYKANWPGDDFRRYAKHADFALAEPIPASGTEE